MWWKKKSFSWQTSKKLELVSPLFLPLFPPHNRVTKPMHESWMSWTYVSACFQHLQTHSLPLWRITPQGCVASGLFVRSGAIFVHVRVPCSLCRKRLNTHQVNIGQFNVDFNMWAILDITFCYVDCACCYNNILLSPQEIWSDLSRPLPGSPGSPDTSGSLRTHLQLRTYSSSRVRTDKYWPLFSASNLSKS